MMRRSIIGLSIFGLLAVNDTIVERSFAQEAQELATEEWGRRDPESVSMASAYYAILGIAFTHEIAFETPVNEMSRASSYFRSVSSLSQESSDALESYGRNSLNELAQRRFERSRARCQNAEQFESKADYVARLRADTEALETMGSEHFDRALDLLDDDDRDVFRGLVSGIRNWVRVTDADRVAIAEASTETVAAFTDRDCDLQQPRML